jgi:hypothetical protein
LPFMLFSYYLYTLYTVCVYIYICIPLYITYEYTLYTVHAVNILCLTYIKTQVLCYSVAVGKFMNLLALRHRFNWYFSCTFIYVLLLVSFYWLCSKGWFFYGSTNSHHIRSTHTPTTCLYGGLIASYRVCLH